MAKEVASKKSYISKLESKLTTGGFMERCVKLEEKVKRWQVCHLFVW